MTSDSTAKPTGPTVLKVPEGDTHERLVCETCGFIHYKNPVVVVGSVCVWQDKFLLCRRAIEPRRGYWTIPAGYLELEESTAEGAAREALEEACARIEIDALLAVYDIPRISQVQIFYAAHLASPDVAPGVESLETKLLDWADIPWDDLAFPSVHWALNDYQAYSGNDSYTVRGNPDIRTP
ncbi:MAG: NUDIX hydrolase [Alphaproteobacteria bacterium]|jgi:ADP-ribose pyrophosphatase YjhB (NUDIX family)